MLDCAERAATLSRCFELCAMALSVVEAQCIAAETALARDRERRGGIETAGKQNDCAAPSFAPGCRPRATLWQLDLQPHRQALVEIHLREVARLDLA
jgi:uncharacterized membrane protein